VYGRTLDGETLTLAASGWTWQNTFVLWDHETESIWFGGAGQLGWDHLVCVEGPLQDRRLSIIPHQRTFWRTWYRAEPETKIMRRRQP
jgi:hypothetical protein